MISGKIFFFFLFKCYIIFLNVSWYSFRDTSSLLSLLFAGQMNAWSGAVFFKSSPDSSSTQSGNMVRVI